MDTTDRPHGGSARIVVGVDGSAAARAALRAALAAAVARGARVEVVSSYAADLYWLGGAGVVVPVVEDVRGATRRRAEELLATVRTEVPGAASVEAAVEVTLDPAAAALVAGSVGAELVVVGNRGRGAVRSALLGSVALHTVTHAHCPVLVVHPSSGEPAQPPRVVVGVDGSAAARVALAAAVEEAAVLGADVRAVATYAVTDYWVDLSTVVLPSREEIRDDLQRRVAESVEAVLAGRPGDGRAPRVEIEVVEGAAADVLVERARDAALLVVGSRGRGSVRGLLVGSVALHCVMHAAGPVLVVHPVRRPAEGTVGPAASALV
ncbi:universal stress protein [Geodermatophilus nigrescens]|uniref:universal stress protein n=1 Tax=Geodermatophilus sp. FMUSA9-8 TaxID=3120155 RepID=UPI003008B3CD